MNDAGYDSPESAAMEGFPPAYCHVVAARVHEDDAYVLLDTGSPGQPYLYGVNCLRQNGRWFDDGSSNGSGGVPCPEEEWPRLLAILTESGWKDYDELDVWRRLLRGGTL
jgi:hypothetical protein